MDIDESTKKMFAELDRDRKMGIFRTTHPENQEGEYYLGPVAADKAEEKLAALREYSNNPLPSLRVGQVAYDENNNVIKGFVPLFVNEKEHRAAMDTPERRRDRDQILAMITDHDPGD